MPRRSTKTQRSRIPVVLYTHPFELALGAALVINGLRALLGEQSPSVATLPTIPLILYLLVSMLGGCGVIIGLTMPDQPSRRGIGISLERASLYLVAAAYAGLAILLIAANGRRGIGSAVVVAVVATACLLRTVAIRRAALIVLRTLREQHRDGQHQGGQG